MLPFPAEPLRAGTGDHASRRGSRERIRGACCRVLIGLLMVGCRTSGSAPGLATLMENPSAGRTTLISSAKPDDGPTTISSSKNRQAAVSGRIETPDWTDDDLASRIESIAGIDSKPANATAETTQVESLVDRALFHVAQEQVRADDPANIVRNSALPDPFQDSPRPLRLEMPSEIPGASAPQILLPETNDEHPEARQAAIALLFPPPPAPRTLPASVERPMTLEELEDLAMQNSPLIVQAYAGITMSQGTTIQAGVYPNPVVGYEADTVGSFFTRNYQGTYLSQLVKTGGKLGLSRAISNMDQMNSQLAYRRTQLEVRRQVRAGYYNVLVANEANRINEALLRFTNQVYSIMVERLKRGAQAPYEPAQLRTLVAQANMALVQSQNRYRSAWKQLAVATGIPQMRPAPLVGRADMNVPNLDFEALLSRVLNVHPDIEASRNFEEQSKLNLRLQHKVPIPDVTVAGAFQNDFTTPGFQRTSYNVQVSVPVPIFDRNVGGIRSAEGKVQLSAQQLAVTQNQLTNQLADAFERYQTGRFQAEYYRTQMLPDLARAYHGVYERHIQQPDLVAFGDIIVAQQSLANGISLYIGSLLQQWVAATDISNLTQLEDFQELYSLPTASSAPGSIEVPQAPSMEGGNP